ncbi:hypothetical protein [Egicoccus sp. AB-alg2]|uniref:hypothetical protein n=1 Tax=Egicoccus sp. AB-alg2 TaxID=3242693 RepID=UPI00359CE029
MEPTSSSAALRGLWQDFAQFGGDWWYVAAVVAAGVVAFVWLAAVGARVAAPTDAPAATRAGRALDRFGAGAAHLTGLPTWSAAGLLVLLGALLVAYAGFVWDVAWHIDLGRDEFLLSPPHVYLLLGLTGLGAAGVVSTALATRAGADVGWRVRRWTVPLGAAGLLVGGALAIAGYWIDEFWHAVYGLDVTMWSPPHLTMISSAVFSPLAGWLLLTEAGRGAGRPWVHRHGRAVLAGASLIALSAWQLEFDLGVPFWQQGYQPVLLALAAGFGLTAARVVLGPGGALLTVAHFVVLRVLGAAMAAGAWGLSAPRFPLYLGAAVAIEIAFRLARGRGPLATSLAAGVGVATLGLAELWVWAQLVAHHPWQPGLLPFLGVAAAAGVAAAVLGGAYGRVVTHRPAGLPRAGVVAALAVVAVAVAVPFPRITPDVDVRILTAPAGEGRVDVVVEVDPPDAAVGADRWEVFAWQGGGRQLLPLQPVAPGRYVAPEPVQVGGSWKAMVRLADGAALGAAPIALPADPEYGQPAIELQAVREQPMQFQDELMLREQQDGPLWPGIVGGMLIAGMILGLLGAVGGGVVAADRRRPAVAPPDHAPEAAPTGDRGAADHGTADHGTADHGTADHGTAAPIGVERQR